MALDKLISRSQLLPSRSHESVNCSARKLGPLGSQVITPAYAHVAEQFPNAVFLEVDVDKLQPT